MEVLNTRALCTLDDLKLYLGQPDEVVDDDLLIRLINAASDAIYTLTGREFKTIGTNPQTRTFDASEIYANGFLYVGDYTDVTNIVVYNSSDDVVATDPDYIKLPRNRMPWEPYQAIRFKTQTVSSTDYIDITGSWGFPSVPEEIRQACVVTAFIWYERDIAKFSGTFSISEDRVELPRAVPAQVSDSLSRYQRLPVG